MKSLHLDVNIADAQHILNVLVTGDVQLEKLVLDTNPLWSAKIQGFGRLKSLKSLLLNVGIEDAQHILHELVAGQVQLECLEFGSPRCSDNMIEFICKIKTLNCLQISSINDCRSARLIQHLDNLTKITLCWGRVSTNGIRHALEQWKQLTKVTIRTHPSDNTIQRNDLEAIDELRNNRAIDVKIGIVILAQLSLQDAIDFKQKYSDWLDLSGY